MTQKKWIYWVFQFSGWGFLLFFSLLSNYLSGELSIKTFIEQIIVFGVGIGITHVYRYFVLKNDWLSNNVVKSIPRILTSSVVLGTIFFAIIVGITYVEEVMQINAPDETVATLFGGEDLNFSIGSVSLRLLLTIINRSFLFFMWSVIYFAYHFFERTRQQEIDRLQWAASINETELNNLKSQLNPHFMFNAMNSIRALVDEDPKLAKKAITQLASLLRQTLQTGKKKLVTISEEMKIVSDYLNLEKIRYEERLQVEMDIQQEIQDCLIPPLLVQTLVENAIKHGISTLAGGGLLLIRIESMDENLILTIENEGTYQPTNNGIEGIGLNNSSKRLEILYGENANITISNKNNRVETLVTLPKETQHQSII